MKPTCYNRSAYRDTLTVQDGWIDGRRNMVTIPHTMTKDCQQHGEYGAARMYGWDCEGCKWK